MATILIGDDHAAVREMLGIALGCIHNTRLAASGAAALEIARVERIDFALLDIQLPEMDGPQLLSALRSINPDMKCCFMSASYAPAPDEIPHSEVVSYLEKPFPLEDLMLLISTQLG